MEDWRAKALEFFPDLRERIEEQSGPMDLWIDLNFELVNAYDQEPINEERIAKVYDYAPWTFEQPDTGDVETNPSSAMAVAFIENIPSDQRISHDLYRWMSAETFDGCEALFRYLLTEEEWLTFSADFHRKKKLFVGPSCL